MGSQVIGRAWQTFARNPLSMTHRSEEVLNGAGIVDANTWEVAELERLDDGVRLGHFGEVILFGGYLASILFF